MLDLDLDRIFTNLCFCTATDYNIIDSLSIILNESDSPKIDNAWDSLLEFFSKQYPAWNETVNSMKSDLFMSLYATLFYATVSPTSKNEIARQISPVIGLDPKDCEKILDRSCKELRDNYTNGMGELRWNQLRKNNNLYYFQPFWMPFSSNLQLKVFDEKDLYLYITNYHDWPFFLNNENGILLCDYYEAIKKLNCKIRKTSKTGIAEQLSFFVFEQLFSPCRLSNLLTSFCKFFEESFYDIDSPIRERAIIFSSALSSLPVNLLENCLENYLAALKKYLYNSDNRNDKKNFIQQLSSTVYSSSYLFPLAQSILLYFIFSTYAKREELQNAHHSILYQGLIFPNNLSYPIQYSLKNNMSLIEILKTALETYISKHIQEFNYSFLTHKAYKNYPFGTIPLKKVQKPTKFITFQRRLEIIFQ